jgi:heme exporter protein CcmD
MGGHYPFVWSAYAVGVLGVVVTLLRPLRARRRFFADEGQRLRLQSSLESDGVAERIDASRPS